MMGKKRTLYCLIKYALFVGTIIGTLGLALFSVGEIEVIPPDFLFSDTITEELSGTQPTVFQTTAETPHHGEIIDSEGKAEYCLQCHQNKDIKSHKILIEYPPPYRREQEITFRPLQEVLALGMKFEDGLLTCISCHDLTNQTRYHFALEPRTGGHAQKLCYVCHLEIG